MARPFLRHVAVGIFAFAAASPSIGCGVEPPPRDPLAAAREAAENGDADAIGRLLLEEMTARGGSPDEAKDARERLDKTNGGGLDAKLARALDDDVHGRGVRAFDDWIDVLVAAHASTSPRAPLVSIVALDRLGGVASLVPRAHRDEAYRGLASLLEPHGAIDGLGWRGADDVASLVAYAEGNGKSIEDAAAIRRARLGCVSKARIAGPFEHAPADDDTAAVEGEKPGSWPAVFEGRPGAWSRPRVIATETYGCAIAAKDSFGSGVYLAETFVDLDRQRDLVLIPGDLSRVAIDDVVVHVRDRKQWGDSLVDGVAVRLAPGRHRIVWRATGSFASLRIRALDGLAWSTKSDDDPTRAYGASPPPKSLNDVHPALALAGGDDESLDPVEMYLAARAALDHGAADVAAVVLTPILGLDAPNLDWPAPILELSADVASHDPIWPVAKATTRAKTLVDRAAQIDHALWLSPLKQIALEGEGTPAAEQAKQLLALVDTHPDHPEAALALLELYDEMGWTYEYDELVKKLVAKFPDDPRILTEQLAVLDAHGPLAEADKLAARLAADEPDHPIEAERLVERGKIKEALAAYETFLASHPAQKETLKARIAELKDGLGDVDAGLARLAKEIAKGEADPLDEADYALAHGEKHALERAIEHSISAYGHRPAGVERALDLLARTVSLAQFRLDGRKVIKEYDATHAASAAKKEKVSAHRILDYGVMWIRSDGTGSFLSHEIVRIDGRDAIASLSKAPALSGHVLRERVLKPDGRELEPERVAGKPDLTFPDLAIGDVIETEEIVEISAPGSGFVSSPRYFAHDHTEVGRSEFVVVTPKGRDVIFERRAGVPEPKTSDIGGVFAVHDFRMDDVPPPPDEPELAPPAEEVVPSVTFGWGMSVDDAFARATVVLAEKEPIDPRMVKRANAIVAGISIDDPIARAKKLYEWVTLNVHPAEGDTDGRRAVVGGSGDPVNAFRVLARAAGVETYVAFAHDRLALPAPSPLSVGEAYRDPVIEVASSKPAFLTFGDRYFPFGYVGPTARGENAIVLRPGLPRVTLPKEGVEDGIAVNGSFALAKTGDASGTITISFSGKKGAKLRRDIDQLSEAQLQVEVEQHLLAGALPGVHLKKVEVISRDDTDKPLGLACDVDVPGLARPVGASLSYVVPIRASLSPLVARPTRVTPVLITDVDRLVVAIDLKLPAGAKITRGPVKGEKTFRHDFAKASDALEGDTLQIRREYFLDVDRVEPAAYPELQKFCRDADSLQAEEILIAP